MNRIVISLPEDVDVMKKRMVDSLEDAMLQMFTEDELRESIRRLKEAEDIL